MRSPVAALALLVLAAPLHGQEPTSIEIGTHVGATVAFGGGATSWSAGIPAPGTAIPLAWPALYATFFATPQLMVEPQVGFGWNDDIGEATVLANLALGWLANPLATASPYFGVNGGWTTWYGDVKSGLLGAHVGMRTLVKQHLSIRFEGRYRRWLCSGCDLNEAALTIGLGAALP